MVPNSMIAKNIQPFGFIDVSVVGSGRLSGVCPNATVAEKVRSVGFVGVTISGSSFIAAYAHPG